MPFATAEFLGAHGGWVREGDVETETASAGRASGGDEGGVDGIAGREWHNIPRVAPAARVGGAIVVAQGLLTPRAHEDFMRFLAMSGTASVLLIGALSGCGSTVALDASGSGSTTSSTGTSSTATRTTGSTYPVGHLRARAGC